MDEGLVAGQTQKQPTPKWLQLGKTGRHTPKRPKKGLFKYIRVQFQPPIAEIGPRFGYAVQGITDRLGQFGFARDFGQLGVQPGFEIIEGGFPEDANLSLERGLDPANMRELYKCEWIGKGWSIVIKEVVLDFRPVCSLLKIYQGLIYAANLIGSVLLA